MKDRGIIPAWRMPVRAVNVTMIDLVSNSASLSCRECTEPRRPGEHSRMTSLYAGLVLPRGSATDLVAATTLAEQRGVGTVWTTVGGPTADPVTAYAAAGVATDRVNLGT